MEKAYREIPGGKCQRCKHYVSQKHPVVNLGILLLALKEQNVELKPNEAKVATIVSTYQIVINHVLINSLLQSAIELPKITIHYKI